MPGRADAAGDLLLAAYALADGAIDRDALIAAVRDWADQTERPLDDILESRGTLDAPTLERLRDAIARDRPTAEEGAGPSLTVAHPLPRAARDEGSGQSLTIAYRSPGATGGDGPAPAAAAPGDGGRFEILGLHARGGLGEVFRAFDRELNRPVALKQMQGHRAHDPDARERFLLEAEVTGKLDHPGVVPVYSLGRHADGRPFYAMRFIEGETLGAAIDRVHRQGSSPRRDWDRDPGFRRLLRSVVDACNTVAFAHSRGVVHRDLKPENIMLGRFGETLVVDWGISKARSGPADDEAGDDASLTRPGAVIGTPRYMSPEQAAGDLDRVGPASDIYSLGAILYCALVGQAPVPDGSVATVLDRVRRGIFPPPRRVRRSVDPALEAICLRAMALAPGDRHPSALDLANDLETWQAEVRYRGEQEVAVGQARATFARLCLERAHNLFDRGAHNEGILWLARALESAPAEPPELAVVIRTSLAAWHADGKSPERTFRHGVEVRSVLFAPEGRRLATAGGDRLRLWDVSSGAPLCPPLPHPGAIVAAAFRADGRTIASGIDGAPIHAWDAVTGRSRGVPGPYRTSPALWGFSPDGSRFAAAGPGGLVAGATDGPAADDRERDFDRAIAALVFSPEGRRLAVADEAGLVLVVDAETLGPAGGPVDHGAAVADLAFDPSGQGLLTAGRDGQCRLWDLDTGRPRLAVAHPGAIHRVAFRPGGESFATAGADGTARLWDADRGLPIGEPLAHRAGADCLAFRPDGAMLATGGADGLVRLWCAATGLPIGPPLAQGGAVRALVFSPDGRRLAVGGSDGSVRCWGVPEPVDGSPARITCWASVATGLEFDEGDAIRRLEAPRLWELRRRLGDLGGAPIR